MGYETSSVLIGKKKLKAKIADSMIKRGKGLSHSPALKENECMLFIFDRNARHALWMRGMSFPIDVLWLDESKRIVDSVAKIKPARLLQFNTYSPRKDARYVIELPAGFLERNRVTSRSRIYFK
jgi:uncharacterized protein